MAQAPDAGGGGAPRQNKTVKQFGGMNTQNQRNAVPEGTFSWLENIQPIGPGNLHSIPGRGQSLVRIPPLGPGCPNDTIPDGEQHIQKITCYHWNSGIPDGTLSGNSAGQLSFVQGANVTEFVATVGDQDGFFIPYPPASNQWQLIHVVGDVISTLPPVTLTGHTASFARQSAQAGMSGHSDELSYVLEMGAVTPQVNGNSSCFVYFSVPSDSAKFFNYNPGEGVVTGPWAKHGDNLYRVSGLEAARRIARYSVATGGFPLVFSDTFATLGFNNDQGVLRMFAATNNFLYALFIQTFPTNKGGIIKFDATTLATVETFLFAEALDIFGFDVASDELIYVGTNAWDFHYFIPGSSSPPELILIGGLNSPPDGHVDFQCVNTAPLALAGQNAFHYNAGFFYLSYGGAGTGFTDAIKIGPLVCPGTNTPIGST